MYDEAHYYDNYLIGLSTRIFSADYPSAGLSSGKPALDFLPLGFIAQVICLENYSAVIPAHQVLVDS